MWRILKFEIGKGFSIENGNVPAAAQKPKRGDIAAKGKN
jgi:hypothetical protein